MNELEQALLDTLRVNDISAEVKQASSACVRAGFNRQQMEAMMDVAIACIKPSLDTLHGRIKELERRLKDPR